MLLGLAEFTRAYLAVKENIWQFLDLVKLVQNARMGNNEVVELLKIANGYLPRVRLEYDRRNSRPGSPNAVGSASCVPFAICCFSGIGHLKAALLFCQCDLIK